MKTRAYALVLLLSPFAAVQACSEDETKSPSVDGLDASLPDATTGDGATSADGAVDVQSPADTGVADSQTDSQTTDAGADVQLGYTPCDRPIDAGDAGCRWQKVEVCGADAALDFKANCGSRTPGRALACADSVVDLASQGGPDGSYYNYRVQRCPDEGCSTNPDTVVWRCIECCP